MKFKTIIWALLIAAVTPCMAQSGYIEMKMTSDKAGTEGAFKVYYSATGSRVEMDMKMGQMPTAMHMVTITKKSNPNIIINLNETAKTFSEMDVSKNTYKDTSTYTVKKVGDETMNGYKCVHVIVTSNKGENEDLWSSKDVVDYEKYHEANKNNPRSGSSENKLKALKAAGADGFPVKMITHRRDGAVTIELVKAEKKDVAASMFEVPADYKKQESPATGMGIKSAAEIQKMTPEERKKYIDDLKSKYGK